MRIIAYPLVFAFALGIAGAAQAAAMPGQSLVDLEARWSKAFTTHDVAAIGAIMADDWSGQNDAGKRMDKPSFLAMLKSGKLSITRMTNHDVHGRVFGDIGVAQGMDDETSSYDGKDTSGTYSWTDVFQKRDGRWQAIASQTTEVKK
jgi:ketosteroid isomerase-like protein